MERKKKIKINSALLWTWVSKTVILEYGTFWTDYQFIVEQNNHMFWKSLLQVYTF